MNAPARRALIGTLLLAAAQLPAAAADATTGIKHIVMCWLKEPGNAVQRERVVATSKELLVIPEVEDMAIGSPVASDRPNVEDGFDVGIVMTFRDEAALRTYLEHPEHMQRVRDTLAPLCARVQIVDIRY